MQRVKGYSLIEVMVVVAILAILAGVGAPSLGNWLQSNQIRGQTATLSGLLRSARVEALTRNNSVTLSTSAGGSNWKGTVQMYLDVSGGNSAFTPADGDILIREMDLSGGNTSIFGNTPAADYVSFDNEGRLDEADPVVFAVCGRDAVTADGYRIEINVVGRVSERKDAQDCTP